MKATRLKARVPILAALAMIAFAANSVIARLALLGEPITAQLLLASFLILSGVLIGVLRRPASPRVVA